jgi:three-Cys-motif partner protein
LSKSKRGDNCHEVDPADGLPVQCVGEWAEDRKHHILRNYVEATREARAKYLPPRGRGGAAFIDLFAGPGRARVRSTGLMVDGSPMISMKHSGAPFTKLIFCDLDASNAAALRGRACCDPRVTVIQGDCNLVIDKIVSEIPAYGLNFALIDPFGLAPMDFDTIKKIASAGKRMDLLIHFPTGDMKRNIAKSDTSEATKARMGKALGEGVRAERPKDVVREVDTLRRNLGSLGYTGASVRTVPVTNQQGVIIYHLVYASRDSLGDKIWQSITSPKQQDFFH